jgi:hypothetical protein
VKKQIQGSPEGEAGVAEGLLHVRLGSTYGGERLDGMDTAHTTDDAALRVEKAPPDHNDRAVLDTLDNPGTRVDIGWEEDGTDAAKVKELCIPRQKKVNRLSQMETIGPTIDPTSFSSGLDFFSYDGFDLAKPHQML